MTQQKPLQNPPPDIQFEKAFHRLEQILEKLNSGEVVLEDSLKLYEEADGLITACNTKLTHAEQRIETLIKNRQGELVMGDQQRPLTQNFSDPNEGDSLPF